MCVSECVKYCAIVWATKERTNKRKNRRKKKTLCYALRNEICHQSNGVNRKEKELAIFASVSVRARLTVNEYVCACVSVPFVCARECIAAIRCCSLLVASSLCIAEAMAKL